jgi:TonB family protein
MLAMTLLIADRGVGAAGDVPPKLLSTAIPEYPKAAYETGREGTVVLELLIDAEGRVVDARVTKSIPEFDGAALACVSQWRFIPAQRRRRPVPGRATAMVIFKRPSKARPTTARGEAPSNHGLKRTSSALASGSATFRARSPSPRRRVNRLPTTGATSSNA